MVSVGDILPLTIDKPAAGGRMIARAERLVVLVSGAIPGERVRAVVERVGKGVVYAAVTGIDAPSAASLSATSSGSLALSHSDAASSTEPKTAIT